MVYCTRVRTTRVWVIIDEQVHRGDGVFNRLSGSSWLCHSIDCRPSDRTSRRMLGVVYDTMSISYQLTAEALGSP